MFITESIQPFKSSTIKVNVPAGAVNTAESLKNIGLLEVLLEKYQS